ncbi:MAG: DNA cytosine methyltransferase, partial [Planctomycetota bacterium]
DRATQAEGRGVSNIAVADLFCGAGGTSIGAHQTGEVKVSFAVNHWDVAIQTHSRNFPKAKHVQTELRWVRPTECDPINMLFASPECTHHSRARGGRPTTDQQRAGAWELLPWIEHHRPSFVVVENVVEFEDWGPVDLNTNRPLKTGKGKLFDAWVMAVQSYGYKVEWQRLNAADYGAATSRERLFVIARKGNRSPCFPSPTHCRSAGDFLPGLELQPWRGAQEIIDWSIPLPSMFGRRRPLALKTVLRIQKGLERHVSPFVVHLRNNMSGREAGQPLGTITAGGGHHGISVPFVATVNHGDDGSNGRRTKAISEALGTVTTRNGRALVSPFLLSAGGCERGTIDGERPVPTILTHQNFATAIPLVMAPQSGGVVKNAETPVPPITTMAGSQLIVPWLNSYYGTQNTSSNDSPVPTITTRDRHAITAALVHPGHPATAQNYPELALQCRMRQLGIADIGFRMLSNEELARAQGFPCDYQFCGTKKDVTKQIGNSVSPPVAKAITEALLG